MKSRLGVAFMGLIVLAGCGGGSSPSVTRSLATKTRALKPGDQWVYSVTGQTTAAGSGPVSQAGTLTLSLTSQSFNSATVLALTSVLAVTGSDGQKLNTTSIVYLTQDPASGDISEVGDNDGSGGTTSQRTVTAPQILFPGTWSQGLSRSSVLQFNTGETQAYSLNVTGTETVQTPLGAFPAWIANAGTGSGISEDWAPQLGAPVKLAVQLGDASSGGVSGTALLKFTNVAY